MNYHFLFLTFCYQFKNLTQDNAVSTLKELAESGRCSIPQYDIPEEQVINDGEY